MLTPQEIKDIRFDKVMFGGYDMVAVDETMAEIASDFSSVVKENAVLKNKLKMLASTIEEYRNVDEAMRKALITAQNLANDMLKDAHEKADELIKNASALANEKVADLAQKVREEEARLAKAKAETAVFIETMDKAYKLQAEKLVALKPEVSAEEVKTVSSDTLSLAAEEINRCVASAIENMKEFEERAKIDAVPEVEAAHEELIAQEKLNDGLDIDLSVFDSPAENSDDTRDLGQLEFDSAPAKKEEIELDDLKFGKNYDFDEE